VLTICAAADLMPDMSEQPDHTKINEEVNFLRTFVSQWKDEIITFRVGRCCITADGVTASVIVTDESDDDNLPLGKAVPMTIRLHCARTAEGVFSVTDDSHPSTHTENLYVRNKLVTSDESQRVCSTCGRRGSVYKAFTDAARDKWAVHQQLAPRAAT
jgi:hypothetical protein